MKKGSLSLVSVCVLSWLIPGRNLAQGVHSSIVSSISAVVAELKADATGPAGGGSEYYVDCEAAERNGDGRSPESAWHALDAVNEHTFLPGDVVYLKRGTECHGMLWPKGSGSASASIRLSAYGRGARPKVIAGKSDEQAFKLFDQEYWDVDSIDFSGGTIFGVIVSGQTGILHHIHIKNLLVHNVRGGDVKHKESGLIVISPGKAQQHFEDVLVEGVTAYATDQWAGILIGGGNFGEVPVKDWNSHVIVRNSIVHDVYGDGIILFRVKDGLIDNSATWNMGMQPTQSIGTPNAIWTWMCQDCVVSRNEAFLTDSPGVDGGAFDIDYGNTRNSVIDNYGHDTQGYCIAVFGAGYVTQESVVEGNLCINNGKSPRMAGYQGALFLLTWNNGVIENLRVEKNTIYWSPPGRFPALINRADIRGSQRIFRENQIYSFSPWMIDSNKYIDFQNNQYETCASSSATWTFDGHSYSSMEQYRGGANQEQGSSWKYDPLSGSCLGGERLLKGEPKNTARPNRTDASALGVTTPGWTVVSDLPASLDAYGLLDSASSGQLMVLKNLYTQFRASGMRIKIKLILKQAKTKEAVPNVIRDLAISDIETLEPASSEFPSHPRTRLVAPDGSVVKEWQEFVGPAEIGLAVRRALGVPLYSQMISTSE